MLKKHKKITKKELKKDPLLIFAAEAADFVRAEWVKIASTIGAVLLVVIISLLLVGMKKRSEISSYDAALAAVQNNAPEATDLLKKVAFKSGGSHAAEALLQLGNRYYQNKDLENSEKCYTEFIKKYSSDPLYGFTAYFNLGGILEEKGNYKAAAETYEKYIKTFQNSVLSPKMRLSAGRAYLLAGEKDSAKKNFLAVAETPKDSREKQEALYYLETLK
ncbi:MAG: tetratricopeptide repeat protein [Candidatus Latescibacterota bacterium]